MPEVEHSWGEAIYDPSHTHFLYGSRIINGVAEGLTKKNRSNKTISQYFANRMSYNYMRDNLHKRPRRRRKHGGRKGEWIR